MNTTDELLKMATTFYRCGGVLTFEEFYAQDQDHRNAFMAARAQVLQDDHMMAAEEIVAALGLDDDSLRSQELRHAAKSAMNRSDR